MAGVAEGDEDARGGRERVARTSEGRARRGARARAWSRGGGRQGREGVRDAREEASAVVGAFWTLGPVPVLVVDTVAVPDAGVYVRGTKS